MTPARFPRIITPVHPDARYGIRVMALVAAVLGLAGCIYRVNLPPPCSDAEVEVLGTCRTICSTNANCAASERCATEGFCLAVLPADGAAGDPGPSDGGDPKHPGDPSDPGDPAEPGDSADPGDSTDPGDSADPGDEDGRCHLGYLDPDGDCYTVAAAPTLICESAQRCEAPRTIRDSYPPETVTQNTLIGNEPWEYPERIYGSDDGYATTTLVGSEASHLLVATGFGFSIPNDAIIHGIEVRVERRRELFGSSEIVDRAARLVRAGALATVDYAKLEAWPTSDEVAIYGGAAELWSENWTPADINDPGFGFALSAEPATSGIIDLFVDHIAIAVHYRHDCDETNGDVWAMRFPDSDGDHVGAGTRACSASGAGYSNLGSDCAPGDETRWKQRYVDADEDGFGTGALVCVGANAGYADLDGDCYDLNAEANPGLESFRTFPVDRGDGSFDYDCDNNETLAADMSCLTTLPAATCIGTDTTMRFEGYVSAVPTECGQSASWRSCNSYDTAACTGSQGSTAGGYIACFLPCYYAAMDPFPYYETVDISAPMECN